MLNEALMIQEAERLAALTLRAHGLRHEAAQVQAAYLQKVMADE